MANFGLPLIGMGPGFGFGGSVGSWGGGFDSCCNRMLGPQQGALTGALLGGLVGTLAGCGNPLIGLLGAGVGGLIGAAFDRPHHCHHHHHHHQQANCYPPMNNGCFGGPQFGGYGCSPNYGNQYGGWGGYQNFGFPQGGNYGQWGAQQNNNYNYQWPGGGQCSPWGGGWGQQWGGGNGCFSPGQNYNFGHCCPPQNCCPCRRPTGQLSQEGGQGKPIEYKTSGGYTVRVDKHQIVITDPQGKNKVEHWGDPHENLNGKHIKDWEGKQRTVILEDGTKITMTAQGPQGVTESMSIYDGRRNIQIDNNQNKITHQSMNPWDTMMRERRQYDGETSIFRTNDRTGVATYSNIYTQDSSFNITGSYQQLGRTGGYSNPSQVRDFYDDPRLGHT